MAFGVRSILETKTLTHQTKPLKPVYGRSTVKIRLLVRNTWSLFPVFGSGDVVEEVPGEKQSDDVNAAIKGDSLKGATIV